MAGRFPRGVAARIAGIFDAPPWVFHHTRFQVLELRSFREPPPAPAGFELAEAGHEALREMTECRLMADPRAGLALFSGRLDRGCRCFTVRDGTGRMQGYTWISVGTSVVEDPHAYTARLGRDSAYVFDTYVHPRARGRGVNPWMLHGLHGLLGKEGIKRLVGIVDVSNERSMRSHAKVAPAVLEEVTFTCVLGLCNHVARRPGGPPRSRRDLYPWMGPFVSVLEGD